jgi:hypothetical protein
MSHDWWLENQALLNIAALTLKMIMVSRQRLARVKKIFLSIAILTRVYIAKTLGDDERRGVMNPRTSGFKRVG